MEGPDDMPAHVKSSLFGASLSIPSAFASALSSHVPCIARANPFVLDCMLCSHTRQASAGHLAGEHAVLCSAAATTPLVLATFHRTAGAR